MRFVDFQFNWTLLFFLYPLLSLLSYTTSRQNISRSFIPSRLTKLHQTLVVKREWAGLVLPSGTGWESPVTIFFLQFPQRSGGASGGGQGVLCVKEPLGWGTYIPSLELGPKSPTVWCLESDRPCRTQSSL